MKQKLITLTIVLAAITSHAFSQTLTLKNTTSCSPVTFIVWAHDCSTCMYSSSCSLESKLISLPIGGSITFSSVTAINSSPGWMGGITATGGSSSGWDAVEFGTHDLSTCHTTVGPNCGGTMPNAVLLCPCNQWDGIWMTDGAGNFVVNVTDYN